VELGFFVEDANGNNVFDAADNDDRSQLWSVPDVRSPQTIRSDRGSVFLRCSTSECDPTFPKYPRFPVLECSGYFTLAR
jgi:hypothetical protein